MGFSFFGVRLVIEDVHHAVSDLDKIDVTGDEVVPFHFYRHFKFELVFKMRDIGFFQDYGNLYGNCGAVAKKHKLLEPRVPLFVSCYRLNDKAGHLGGKIVFGGEKRVGKTTCRVA